MLSNAYFLAKFRFDTAENEPAKNLQILPILLTLTPKTAVYTTPACSTPAPPEVLGATIVRVQTPVSQPEMFGARTIVPRGHAERCNYSLAEDILLPR